MTHLSPTLSRSLSTHGPPRGSVVRRRHVVLSRLILRHVVGLATLAGVGTAVLLRAGMDAVIAALVVLLPTAAVAFRGRDPLADWPPPARPDGPEREGSIRVGCRHEPGAFPTRPCRAPERP
jgi:hypothetical protein